MIERILIANRGEISLRAIRTIKEMGKKSIAIYSAGDKGVEYLKQADLAICIGPSKSIDSYLNIPAIIAAAEISSADAIFPGYGFLSENQQFVDICRHHNINFIGPSVRVMELMSDKAKAKDVMREAGVPVIEGNKGALSGISEAKKFAKKIGYPVILKASAGGGGKGMRVVEKEDQMESLFFACENEAVNAFANGELYMEKFIHNPRHIEVQILADKHGNVIHLGERDCSMQRRHQKLIEETPATVLTQEQRDELVNVAVKAAKFIKYENAGTFEFLVDKNNNFYFMEMNTRLQVEHPVSEYVSGLDVVEWMIKIAQGEKLPKQQDIVLNGHSLECRITAEDSVTFAPSPGKITKWIAPGGRNVRVDSHAYSGYVVPPHYDSMIGKLIVWGKDREEAISTMKRALDEFQVEGIKTSIDFHKKMMLNQDFITNNYDTKYLDSQK
jgi:acetyl-CoA carboxylase biotin carboxylase subunit